MGRPTAVLIAIALASPPCAGQPPANTTFVKGCFHQHAAQQMRKCLRGADGVQRKQEECGTDADVLLAAVANSSRGYAFVGLMGNEQPPLPPRHDHGLVWLSSTENQMAAVCTTAGDHCPAQPCAPTPPPGGGPFKATVPAVNNLHRQYIENVPGVFVQHPTTDPQREQVLTNRSPRRRSPLHAPHVYPLCRITKGVPGGVWMTSPPGG